MIKINLISKGGVIAGGPASSVEMSFDAGSADIQKHGVIRLFIILLGPLALYIWQNQNLPLKNATVSQKQTILNELIKKNESAKSAVEEIKKYKTDEAKLKEQINTIESLRKDRMREVRILDLIQREMPERMWLGKIEMRDNKISIGGYAAADSELTQFMDTLSRSVFMQDVNLVKTTEKLIDGAVLKEFSISAGLKKTEAKTGVGGAG